MQQPFPCPFCGLPPTVDRMRTGAPADWWVHCDNDDCPTTPDTRGHRTPLLAVRAWNCRPLKPAPNGVDGRTTAAKVKDKQLTRKWNKAQ